MLEDRVKSPSRSADYNPTKSAAALHDWINHNPIEDFAGEKALDATLPVEELVKLIA